MAASYSEQVEELNETVSALTQQLNQINDEKSAHGQKFLKVGVWKSTI